MTAMLLKPNDAVLVGAAQIGGKADKLSWLSAQGFAVPDWFVLSTAAFDCQLQPMQAWLQTQLHTLPDHPEQVSEVSRLIQEKITGMSLNPTLQDDVARFLGQFEAWESTFFAVRSSVTDEDGQQASFAGQMDSFLFQQGLEAIYRAIVKVFASAFSERALRYRQQKKITLTQIKAAVVVQCMIEGETSGVLFTAHPVTGSRQHLLIAACFGCGEGIVSGVCNTDEWTCDGQGNVIETQLNCKDVQMCFDQTAGIGVTSVAVPSAEQNQPCLQASQIAQLVAVGSRIAQQLQCPQDIEWTLKDDQIYVLQTRPITALPPPQHPQGQVQIWDNSNIQESYCGVTTPLTFSFASRAYATVYAQTMRVAGLSEAVIGAHKSVLDNLLGLIHGRVYYNINNWYRGLCLLPAFKTNKSDMERMMGLQDPVAFIQDKQLSWLEKCRKLPSMLKALASLSIQFKRLDNTVPAFRAHFKSIYQGVDRQQLHRLEIAELMALNQHLDEALLMRWTPPIINDFYVMMMNGKVHRGLLKAGIEQPESLQNRLLSGETDIESTQPTKVLLTLCEAIRASEALQACFARVDNAHLLVALKTTDASFHQQCLDYIEAYGDRTMGELKLETISLRENPAFMFAVLKNFLKRDDLTLATLTQNEQKLRQDAEEEAFSVLTRTQGKLACQRFKKHLGKLRQAIKNRENMRFARTRMFGLYRDIYREIGSQCAFYGVLAEARDIFYLTVQELDRYLQGRSVQADLKTVVAARKVEFEAYEAQELPHHFSTVGPVYHHNDYRYEQDPAQKNTEDSQHLTGTGCYPGVVENRIKLIFSPDDELDLNGQILCTVRTDPGWAPLFPSAGGILVERGSTLSHSAVVARELGIPAIVGIPNLTEIMRDGERVRMDGAQGTVERQEV